jgi:hypothetical protein
MKFLSLVVNVLMTISMIATTGLVVSARSVPISTTVDGNLQAIAQRSDSINVYVRMDGKPVDLYVDDIPRGVYQPSQSTGLTCIPINDLTPNTTHRFRIGQDGPEAWEKTWAKLHDGDFDVLVIGANAAGVAAAVTCARKGLRVALVEDTNRIGGMSSNGLGLTDMRRPKASNGFFEEFRRSVVAFRGGGDGLRYEPRVANALLKSMVYQETNILLYLKCTATEPIMHGNKVIGAVVKNLIDGSTARITAKVVIDDTAMGDFSAACGAKFMFGREPRSQAEEHAGQIYFNGSVEEILPNSTGRKDKKMQSYAYLMTWKDYQDQPAPDIAKPAHYDPVVYQYSPEWKNTWAYMYARLAPDKYEINQHPFGTDWPGINHDYIKASPERRKEIDQLYKDRALGYLYYIRNEQKLNTLGLADDEYPDSDNFPPMIYARETRRFIGEYLMREDDVRGLRRASCPDSIAIGDYPMDSHAMEDLKDPNRLDRGEGEFFLKSFTPPYSIPYGVIVPKSVENLLIPGAVSATHVAHGTLRMEPVQMSLGQAAGIAAYLSITKTQRLRKIDPASIQELLLEQSGYIIFFDDVTPDTAGFRAIQFLGANGLFAGESFRPNDQITRADAADAIEKLAIIKNKQNPFSLQDTSSGETISANDLVGLISNVIQLTDADKTKLSAIAGDSSALTRSEAAQIIYNAYILINGRNEQWTHQ